MQSEIEGAAGSKGARWTGWVMSAIPTLLILLSGVMKLIVHQHYLVAFDPETSKAVFDVETKGERCPLFRNGAGERR